MNNVWITQLLQAGIGKKIAKNCHKKKKIRDFNWTQRHTKRKRFAWWMYEEFPSSNAWFYILHGLGSVSLHGPLSTASFSYYPSFSISFLLSSLLHHLGFKSYCKLLLLDLSTEWFLTICMQSQMLHESLSCSWGANCLQFSLLISHYLLSCPFLHSKLNRPELCATIG